VTASSLLWFSAAAFERTRGRHERFDVERNLQVGHHGLVQKARRRDVHLGDLLCRRTQLVSYRTTTAKSSLPNR